MTERELDVNYHKIILRESKMMAEFYADNINKYTKALDKMEKRINHHAEQIKQLEESE